LLSKLESAHCSFVPSGQEAHSIFVACGLDSCRTNAPSFLAECRRRWQNRVASCVFCVYCSCLLSCV